MKVELKYNSKKYVLETKSISGFIKSQVRTLENEKQNKLMEALKSLGSIQLHTISLDELFLLNNYQKEYPTNMPSEITRELKPIYKKLNDELESNLLDWYAVELAKILLDYSKLNEDIQDLIKSEFESEFWQNQDEEELLKIVDFFRRRRA